MQFLRSSQANGMLGFPGFSTSDRMRFITSPRTSFQRTPFQSLVSPLRMASPYGSSVQGFTGVRSSIPVNPFFSRPRVPSAFPRSFTTVTSTGFPAMNRRSGVSLSGLRASAIPPRSTQGNWQVTIPVGRPLPGGFPGFVFPGQTGSTSAVSVVGQSGMRTASASGFGETGGVDVTTETGAIVDQTGGIASETGYPGDTGVGGETGYPGDTGVGGETGYPGDTGVGGETGYPGDTVVGGETGYPGDTVVGGETGYTGDTGDGGEAGYPGETGTGIGVETGFAGDSAVGGETGFPGDTGIGGETGFPGDSGFGEETGFPGEPSFPGDTGLPDSFTGGAVGPVTSNSARSTVSEKENRRRVRIASLRRKIEKLKAAKMARKRTRATPATMESEASRSSAAAAHAASAAAQAAARARGQANMQVSGRRGHTARSVVSNTVLKLSRQSAAQGSNGMLALTPEGMANIVALGRSYGLDEQATKSIIDDLLKSMEAGTIDLHHHTGDRSREKTLKLLQDQSIKLLDLLSRTLGADPARTMPSGTGGFASGQGQGVWPDITRGGDTNTINILHMLSRRGSGTTSVPSGINPRIQGLLTQLERSSSGQSGSSIHPDLKALLDQQIAGTSQGGTREIEAMMEKLGRTGGHGPSTPRGGTLDIEAMMGKLGRTGGHGSSTPRESVWESSTSQSSQSVGRLPPGFLEGPGGQDISGSVWTTSSQNTGSQSSALPGGANQPGQGLSQLASLFKSWQGGQTTSAKNPDIATGGSLPDPSSPNFNMLSIHLENVLGRGHEGGANNAQRHQELMKRVQQLGQANQNGNTDLISLIQNLQKVQLGGGRAKVGPNAGTSSTNNRVSSVWTSTSSSSGRGQPDPTGDVTIMTGDGSQGSGLEGANTIHGSRVWKTASGRSSFGEQGTGRGGSSGPSDVIAGNTGQGTGPNIRGLSGTDGSWKMTGRSSSSSSSSSSTGLGPNQVHTDALSGGAGSQSNQGSSLQLSGRRSSSSSSGSRGGSGFNQVLSLRGGSRRGASGRKGQASSRSNASSRKSSTSRSSVSRKSSKSSSKERGLDEKRKRARSIKLLMKMRNMKKMKMMRAQQKQQQQQQQQRQLLQQQQQQQQQRQLLLQQQQQQEEGYENYITLHSRGKKKRVNVSDLRSKLRMVVTRKGGQSQAEMNSAIESIVKKLRMEADRRRARESDSFITGARNIFIFDSPHGRSGTAESMNANQASVSEASSAAPQDMSLASNFDPSSTLMTTLTKMLGDKGPHQAIPTASEFASMEIANSIIPQPKITGPSSSFLDSFVKVDHAANTASPDLSGPLDAALASLMASNSGPSMGSTSNSPFQSQQTGNSEVVTSLADLISAATHRTEPDLATLNPVNVEVAPFSLSATSVSQVPEPNTIAFNQGATQQEQGKPSNQQVDALANLIAAHDMASHNTIGGATQNNPGKPSNQQVDALASLIAAHDMASHNTIGGATQNNPAKTGFTAKALADLITIQNAERNVQAAAIADLIASANEVPSPQTNTPTQGPTGNAAVTAEVLAALIAQSQKSAPAGNAGNTAETANTLADLISNAGAGMLTPMSVHSSGHMGQEHNMGVSTAQKASNHLMAQGSSMPVV